MLAMVGSLAVAIDLGHLFLAQCELQAAADAGAMAGTLGFLNVPPGSTGPVPISPDCARGRTTSRNVVMANRADGASLSIPDTDISFGRWDAATKSFTDTGCSDPSKVTAVKVVARKDATANNPVPLNFTGLIGMREKSLAAESVGLTGYTGSTPEGVGAFPLAVDRNKVPPNNTTFQIALNPTIADDGCWHTFKQDNSGTSDIKEFIDGTKPSPALRVGDQINVKEGVSDAALQFIDKQLKDYTKAGKNYDVVVPIIPADSSHSGWQEVLGFATLRITKVEAQGTPKYVEGNIVKNMMAPGTEPGGPDFGTWAAVPKIVQ
jgi:hypothetical protein